MSLPISMDANEMEATGKPAQTDQKFLTFFLAEEEYGIEILKVQEIIGLLPITRVPRTPSCTRGVINLRGKVISVVDLRLKFGMEEKAATPETCIIVVQSAGMEMGIIVDKVSEVSAIAASEIDAPPSFGTAMTTDYILGIGKAQGNVKLLLDIDRVLSTQELLDLHAGADTANAG